MGGKSIRLGDLIPASNPMTHQGTTSLLTLALEGRERAPHLLEWRDHKKCAEWMLRAADVIERLAPLELDIEVVEGEN